MAIGVVKLTIFSQDYMKPDASSVAHGFGGELKDDAVGRRKAAIDRDVHAHLVQVAGEANDVSLLPRALVRLFAILPLELSGTVDRPRVLVVAHTEAPPTRSKPAVANPYCGAESRPRISTS